MGMIHGFLVDISSFAQLTPSKSEMIKKTERSHDLSSLWIVYLWSQMLLSNSRSLFYVHAE